MPLTAVPLVESATTLAMFTPAPPNCTEPVMLPVEPAKDFEGYSSEIPAMSSAANGAALVTAEVACVDMTLDVSVCCSPSACPSSCTMVRKKESEKLDC